MDAEPDYLEVITPNMLLTGRSAMALPNREFVDESCPKRRLAHRLELERAWWDRWSVHCFDSLLPSQKWTTEVRSLKKGDVVLIKYSDKSKAGTYRLGIIEDFETDEDGLVRTYIVGYRLVRSDLPVEEMRLYFKGIKWKQIRVPVQRLVVILPVEEQEGPGFLKRSRFSSVCDKIVIKSCQNISDRGEQLDPTFYTSASLDELDSSEFGDAIQVRGRDYLVHCYRNSLVKRHKVQTTYRSVKILHRAYSDIFGCRVKLVTVGQD